MMGNYRVKRGSLVKSMTDSIHLYVEEWEEEALLEKEHA